MMNYRNPSYNAHGTIDCEVNISPEGVAEEWAPFTASPDDAEENGRDIYAAAISAGDVAPYVPGSAIVPESVSARQFKLQLLAQNLLDQVETWVASQSQAVQIAYANSGTFVRDEPMMQAGFAALGFTSQQINDFFTQAAAL
jgi:hypothetical protein